MPKKLFHIRFSTLAVLFVLTVVGGPAMAAEFSADITEQHGDYVKSGKIFVQGSKYCMDIMDSGEKIIVIVDPEAKKTTVIVVSAKEYRELPIDDMTSLMNDPFQAYKYTAEQGDHKNAGPETVDGWACDKFVISMMDTDVMSQWVAKKLNFPIKIIAHGPPDKVVQLSNIVEGPVDEIRFRIPEGFTKWIDPETLPVEPPAWAEGIAAAAVMTPPFEQDMSAGDIVRIKVEPGKSLKIKGVSKTEASAEARAIPFKDGRPLKKDTWYNNFAQKGVICARRHETSAEADEFVVYVYEGEITAIAKWQEMHEHTVAAGREFGYTYQGHNNVETVLVNLSDGESIATIDFIKDGKPISEDEIGPLKYRTITLENTLEVEKGARVAKGDAMVIKVVKGKMLIKLGQFDSFEF